MVIAYLFNLKEQAMLKQKMLALCMVTAVLGLTACASDSSEKYAALENMSDTERNEAFKECFKEENKADRHECIARYAPPEVGYKCEIRAVTGSRLGERVCSTERQRQAERTMAVETLDKVQRNSKPRVEGM